MRLVTNFFKGVSKKEALSWAFFDFANSSYSLLIISFVFPIYFRDVIAGGGPVADFYWGLVVAISVLAGGLSAPVIGAIADYDTRRKRKFILFSLLAMIGTAAFYFTGSGLLLFSSLLFIATNIFFELAVVFYDSFLARVSSKATTGRISGLGWGLGYLGGIVAMLLLAPLYSQGYGGELDSMYKLTFPFVSLFFLAFALPAFFFIREPTSFRKKESLLTLIRIGFQRTWNTIKEVKKHKNIAWFLVGFYFLNDALVTLFAFTPIYAKTTFALSFSEILILLFVVQLIGFPASVIFGWLSDTKGPKRILLLTLGLWSVIIILLSIANSKEMFYVIASLIGLVVGSSQAVARSWLSKIIPEEKRAEFFGFNGFASKISATTGPVIFGAVSAITGNQRIAMLALLPFFLIAFLIFSRLKEA